MNIKIFEGIWGWKWCNKTCNQYHGSMDETDLATKDI